MPKKSKILVEPLTAERWDDLLLLFGDRGACCGCWCMSWRIPPSEFQKASNQDNRERLQHMTMQGQVPGLLAYFEGKPVGWCSIGPRQDYARLEASRKYKRLDDKPVWSIVCFFTDRSARGQGLMTALIRGAVDYARQNGARIVEAYPTDLQAEELAGHKLTGDEGYMGIASAFRRAGFKEAKWLSPTRLVMRKSIGR